MKPRLVNRTQRVAYLPHHVRVVSLLPTEVPQEGSETPPEWDRLIVVAAEMPLANHVRFIPGLVHVLGQHLSETREEAEKNSETSQKQFRNT